MSGIGAIPPVGPPMGSQGVAGVSQIGPQAGAASGKTDFRQMLQGALDRAEGDQSNSARAIEDLLAGRTDDVMPVVTAVAKADMSFKLLIGVRNKVIEAYRQTMNMQV